MDPERFAHLKEILLTAGSLGAEERASYLRAAVDGDPDLAREVESLLSQQAATGGPLVTGGLVVRVMEKGPRMPERVGPYKILGVLGEGVQRDGDGAALDPAQGATAGRDSFPS